MPFSGKSNKIYIHEGLVTSCPDNVVATTPGVSLVPSSQSSSQLRLDQWAPSGSATPRDRESVWVENKERLSEVVTNIRGVNTALANVSIELKVTSVVVVTKLSDETLPTKTRQVVEWFLETRPDIQVSIQDVFMYREGFDYPSLLQKFPNATKQLQFWTFESLPEAPNSYDMVITLGGDGTVLFSSWLFQKVVPPVLSFGLGSLGFMTGYDFEYFRETIAGYLDNGIQCSLRMRFSVIVMRASNRDKFGPNDLTNEIESIGKGNAGVVPTHTRGEEYVILNDIVVDRGPNPVMTMTELYGNFQFLTTIAADGVVISTPTGSTAYSMSAGGSLVHPDNGATIVTPICPHTLSFRPLVLPDTMTISVGVPYDARISAYASFDGRKRVELQRGDFLVIAASRYPFPKIIPESYTSASWVQQLGKNLHWNELRRQKRLS